MRAGGGALCSSQFLQCQNLVTGHCRQRGREVPFKHSWESYAYNHPSRTLKPSFIAQQGAASWQKGVCVLSLLIILRIKNLSELLLLKTKKIMLCLFHKFKRLVKITQKNFTELPQMAKQGWDLLKCVQWCIQISLHCSWQFNFPIHVKKSCDQIPFTLLRNFR